MYRLLQRGRVVCLAGLLAAGPFAGLPARAAAPLSADDVIRRAVERVDSRTNAAFPHYQYRKHTVTEELDKKGRLKEHKEKLYDVLVESGFSSLQLVQLDGKNLPPAELKKQQARDAAERAKIMDHQPGHPAQDRENLLSADLASRFKFTLVKQELVKDRMAYEIAFEPKSTNLPVKKLTDRLVNHVAGTVWIDAQDFEIAKAVIHLNSEITLWGGIVGTLRRCDYTLMRSRMSDGVWYNYFSHGVFEGRKLLEPMLIKTLSESTDFHDLTLARH